MILVSMLVIFIISLSTGYPFIKSLLCAITYYRICDKCDEKYCRCGPDDIPKGAYSSDPYTNDYDVIGGVSGLGWVL
jgi:hypothetical protein